MKEDKSIERSISGMVGKGSLTHNSRAFKAKNVKEDYTQHNIEYCNENIKTVYHELFDEALERYNAKQTRSDRKIADLISHFRYNFIIALQLKIITKRFALPNRKNYFMRLFSRLEIRTI